MALGVTALASLAIAADASSGTHAAARAGSACDRGSVPVDRARLRDTRRAIRCLLNRERAVHGLSKLGRNQALERVAERHTAKMVRTHCIAHVCPGEAPLEDRIRTSGYLDSASSWRYAENTGCGVSAKAMVSHWMDSVYHRVNILEPGFRDIGIGASKKRVSRRCGKDYGTFAVVFGVRK